MAGRRLRHAVALAALLLAVPVSAQDRAAAAQGTAESAIAAAQAAYGQSDGRHCAGAAAADANAVVVCGRADDARYRVPSSSDLDPTGAGAKDAVPRVPRLGPPPCVPSLLTMCAGVGRAIGAVLLIDLAAIPEPPAGSDADRIAKGALRPD